MPNRSGSTEESGPLSTSGLSPKISVLVVEDMEPLRKYLQTILTKEGYKVLHASNGEEALRVAETQTERIDALVCHWMLPGMAGPAVAERIQLLYPRVKIVLMSASDPGPIPDGCTFVSKPFQHDEFLKIIRDLLTGTPGAKRAAKPSGR